MYVYRGKDSKYCTEKFRLHDIDDKHLIYWSSIEFHKFLNVTPHQLLLLK